jgi:hypothetical protein
LNDISQGLGTSIVLPGVILIDGFRCSPAVTTAASRLCKLRTGHVEIRVIVERREREHRQIPRLGRPDGQCSVEIVFDEDLQARIGKSSG